MAATLFLFMRFTPYYLNLARKYAGPEQWYWHQTHLALEEYE